MRTVRDGKESCARPPSAARAAASAMIAAGTILLRCIADLHASMSRGTVTRTEYRAIHRQRGHPDFAQAQSTLRSADAHQASRGRPLPTGDDRDWVARARALAPVIEAAANRTEQERKIPSDVLASMHDAGLLHIL